MDQWIIVLTLLSILLVLLYKWSVAKYNIFSERGVAHDKPWPLIGNIPIRGIFGRISVLKHMAELNLKYSNSPVYGIYALRDPYIFVRDPELIKLIGIKEFDHFVNHHNMHNNMQESILSKSLISLRDGRWREMRNILTPAFTGSKMRIMFELIQSCSEEGVLHVLEQLQPSKEAVIDLEMKDYFTRFANDVIATVAFGLSINSFRRKDNEFFRIGQALSRITPWSMAKAMLHALFPRLMKILQIQVLDGTNVNYFTSLVNMTMKYRQEHKVKRPDMIHLLMEAKQQRLSDLKNQSKDSQYYAEFTDEDLLAQCLLFFFAGFEIISSSLCFLTHELCLNPVVQDRLYEEILAVQGDLNGQPLTYDKLTKMKYLDMVVLEGLRKWPPAIYTDRECCQDIDLFDDNGEKLFSARKGDILQIPIFSLHHDPENFEDPESFNPERFAEDRGVEPRVFLPFGVGPRNCIGNRMALMELKSIVYQLILNFKLLPAERTSRNLLDDIRGYDMHPKDGFWLKFKSRQ
ncbi:probable cytochrome P450 9h1 [Drosophila ficusphila]|uniref:probable cytochrome P450 9h1 n=1 Tax=Drosophila ficusphila TaxID=30025 RepID=UPI0007E6DF81|nr:probable cytochrome P450 9h1 [Drosophila ficusphila]